MKPIETNVSGIRIGELLPGMAKIADRYVIVRSAHHDSDAHGHGTHYNPASDPSARGFDTEPDIVSLIPQRLLVVYLGRDARKTSL